MPKTSQVPVGSRSRIIGLLLGNHGIREISKIVGIPPSTVSYIARKWRKSGLTANLKRSDLHSNLKDRDLRYLTGRGANLQMYKNILHYMVVSLK